MKNLRFEACTLVADHAPFEREQNRDKLFVSAPDIITEETSPDGKIRCKTTHRIITINCDTAPQIPATLERNRDCLQMVDNQMARFTAELLRHIREGHATKPAPALTKTLMRRGHSTQALEVPLPQILKV